MKVKIYNKANRKSTWIFSSMLHKAASTLLQSDACQEKLDGILDMGNSYNIVFRDLNKQYIATVSFILLLLIIDS